MVVHRPKDEEELQKREAIGVIRASRFVRKCAQLHKPINVATIRAIHKEIFKDAWSEIAGMFRNEELSIADSDLLLPHSSRVPELMEKLDTELAEKIEILKKCEGYSIRLTEDITDETVECIKKVLTVTSWLHHAITIIHPFREGNGRTARLVGNLILERYGLVGISVKLEKENKNQYQKALRQIDIYGDYGPLEMIISEGIIDRYAGVPVKYYKSE